MTPPADRADGDGADVRDDELVVAHLGPVSF